MFPAKSTTLFKLQFRQWRLRSVVWYSSKEVFQFNASVHVPDTQVDSCFIILTRATFYRNSFALGPNLITIPANALN
jgi:hypothetical protein